MNLDELMQSIGQDYPHPYAECYKMGKEKGIEEIAKAIREVLGIEALAKVTEHLKNDTATV